MKNPLANNKTQYASARPSSATAPERDIDLYELMTGIVSRWRMIFGFLFVAVVLAFVVLMFTKPRYTSEVRILFGDTETEVLNAERVNARPSINGDLVRSQVHVLRSRDLMALVIKDLELTDKSEFVSSNENIGFKQSLFIRLGVASDPRLMSPQERAWMTLAPRLSVYPLPESRVIALDMWSFDPKLAAAIANRLAEVYLNETKAAKSRSNRQATEWLAGRIEDLQNKVRTAEAEVERFRAQAGLLQGSTSTLSAQELSGIKGQIIVASANRSQAEARARQIRKLLRKRGNINSSNEVLQSPFIRRMREQQVTLRRLVADLSSKYLPTHPRMIRLKAEIQDLSRQVRGEMRKIVSSLQGQADVAAARVASLNANLDRVKVTAEQVNSHRVRLKALERDAKASSQLLETYMRRFREASARADIATQSPNARIISKAYVANTPSYPKKGPILILLTIAVLVFGVVIAFLLEIFSEAPARRVAETRRMPLLPSQEGPARTAVTQAFASVKKTAKPKPKPQSKPSAPLKKAATSNSGQGSDEPPIQVSVIAELPAIPYNNSPDFEIEPVLRAKILDDNNYRQGIVNLQNFIATASPPGRGTKVLAMSNLHNFDKSVSLLALARKLSAEGHSVLVIDADFQMQNLSRSLNLTAFQGTTDLITGSALFTDVVIQDTYSTAHIIAAGERVEFNHDDEADVRLDAVVDAFSHAYDCVIIDGGMAYPAAPMWSLTRTSDVNIVFMADGEAEEIVSDLAAQVYDRSQSGILGIVSIEEEVEPHRSMKFFRRDAAA